MTRQMADDEVLRVLAMARVCVANYPSHDPMVRAGPVFDPAAAAAQFDAAVAALQAERDEQCKLLAAGVERELNFQLRAERAESALEALRGQVEGLATEFSENATHSRHKQAVEVWAYIGQKLAALLAIKERMG